MSAPGTELLKTPLHALHVDLGARMVPFAGYSMPVQYPAGLIAEHRHVREAAGLFDVSHMGQVKLVGADAAAALESLMPVDVMSLGVDKQRYGLLLTDQGTIIDDLMFVNFGDPAARTGEALPRAAGEREGPQLFLIVNGACKAGDIAHMQARIGERCQVLPMPERALLALQGPKAVDALKRLVPGVEQLVFMTGSAFGWNEGGEFLFIDARQMGYMKDRVLRDFTRDDIEKIARTFHAWQQGEGYENVSGFCHAATLEAVRKHEHVLTPGRYVGTAEQEEDGEPFAETMQRLTAQLAEQFVESTKLEAEIKKNLAGLGYSLEKQESEHE